MIGERLDSVNEFLVFGLSKDQNDPGLFVELESVSKALAESFIPIVGPFDLYGVGRCFDIAASSIGKSHFSFSVVPDGPLVTVVGLVLLTVRLFGNFLAAQQKKEEKEDRADWGSHWMAGRACLTMWLNAIESWRDCR